MVQNIRILVVDDDSASRGARSRLLASAGYEVLEAATGRDCLRLAQEYAPDLILLGVSLPDVDGFELCRSVKAVPGLAGSSVVVIWGVGGAAEGQSDAHDAGADVFITRPELDRDLLAWVQVLLRAKRAEEALREQTRVHIGRMKELSCLYGISALVERIGFDLPKILQGIVELMPAAWRYPEVAAARIVLDGHDFRTANYLRTDWRQVREIQVRDEPVGTVEVCYLEEMPEGDEGPFLKDERSLLNAIAERLGRIVERVWAQESLEESDLRYRALFESAPVGIGLTATTGKILEANEALLQMTGYTAADLAQVDVRNFYGDVEDRERLLQRVRAEGAARDFEAQMKRKDGTPFPARMSTRFLTLGGEDILLTVVEDFTERKLAEDRLAEQLQFVKTLLDTIPNPVFYKDRLGRYTGCNKAFAEFIGMAEDEIIGLTDYDVAPTTIADGYLEKDQELLQNPGKQRYEWQVRVASGELRDVIFDKATIKDADGKIGGLIGVISDITDRRRVEEALRESESRLRTVFESLPFDLFVLGEDDRYVLQNSKCRERWGDLIGKRLADADVDRETLALWRENNQRALAGELVQDEVVLCPHGEVGHYYNITSPIQDGARVRGILGVNIDITARKQAEQKLAETNQLLETIFAHTHMLVAYLDPQFDFLWVNQAYAAADQREPSFFPGKNHFALYPNEENEEIFRTVVETGEAHFSYAKPFEYPENPERGVSFWDWGLVPIKDSRGNVTGLVLTLLDVTERIRMQEALQRSEERYALAQRAAHIGSWDWNITSGALHWSEAIGPMFGFELGEFGATYEAFLECVHPDDREQVIAAINRCVAEGADYAIEHRVVWPDGTVRWVSETGDVLRDASGQAIRMLGVVRDITARRRAVDALIESEEKFRNLAEQSPNMIFINKQGRIVYVNPKCEEVMGYTSDEFYGEDFDFLRLIAPEDVDLVREGFARHINGEAVPAYEYGLVTKTGKRLSAIIAPKLIKYEEENAILGIVTDITERKQAEEELRKLSRVVEQSPSVVVIVDPAGDIVYVNPKFTEITGYSGEEAVGKNPRILKSGRQGTAFYEELWRTILAGKEWRGEFVNRRKNGEHYWELATIAPIRNVQGEITHYVKVAEDITERVRAEVALRESEERYRDLVENINDVIYTVDERGVLTYVSPAIESFIGYTPAEAMGLHFGSFCHPEDLSRMRQGFQKLLSGQVTTDEYRAVTKPGELRWMRTSSRPIMDGDRVVGVHGVLVDITDRKTAEHALREAKEAAEVAKRDEEERRQEADERRRIAEGLADVVAVLNSNKSLDEVLDFIAVQAGQLLDNQAVAIYSLQGELETLAIEAAHGLPIGYVAGADIPIGHSALRRAVLSKAPEAVPDVAATFQDDQDVAQDAYRRALVEYWADIYNALLAVPIVVKDEIYGAIMLYYADTRVFSEDEIELARVFANQAALAIENSGLRDQVRETAATAERSRLARELHDAVTQTLFSASLIAEALPRVWEKDRAAGRRGLEELRQLTRGASAEMRTMLLELRPAALTEKPLGESLRHLTDAVTGRSRVPVMLTVEGDSALPPQVQIALYRIAQEALNNVSKHAGASKAEVELRCRPGVVTLSVRDDGCGFDPRDVRPDQLGLAIMGERAERISASLDISSELGHGTQVVVDWKPL